MFRECIQETPFSNQIADEAFPNITGQSYNRDVSFLSSIRALIAPRLGDGERIDLRFTYSSYSQEPLQERGYKKAISHIYNDDEYLEGSITIHDFRGYDADNQAWLTKIKENFTKAYKSYEMVEKFTLFFSNSFEAYLFVDAQHRKSVIFCDNLDLRVVHYFQVALPVIFPWYFTGENAISQDSIEFKFVNSLIENTSESYMAILTELAKPYDFRTAKIKNLLRGFESRYERQEISNLENSIARIVSDIDNYNRVISDLLREKRGKDIRLLGLRCKVEGSEENTDLMDFFICNKNIELDQVQENGDILFYVTGEIENYDEDMAERIIHNRSSYAYLPDDRACNNFIPADDMQMLLEAIFLEQTLSVRFCAKYCFSLTGNVRGCSHSTYGELGRNCMPNPHIHLHSCMGSYTSIINEMLRDNNYIGALTQCIASCKSLNFSDSTVMRGFFRMMYGLQGYENMNRCVVLPDGKVVKPLEAVEWLKSQQAEEHTDGDE